MAYDKLAKIYLNSGEITTYVISYNREQQLCTGIGLLDISLSGNYPTEVVTWDELEIYENDILVGTYYVSEVAIDSPSYLVNIKAQDGSKRMLDYFIAESYDTADVAYTTRYWIEKFLTEAGVSYQFQDDLDTVTVSNNTSLGKLPVYEQIIQLLQMSGWYMYFDEYNICTIGKVDSDLSEPNFSFDESDLLSIKLSKSDKILRNRAVVWGTTDPTGKEWVFADVKRSTPWLYSNDDSRTAVVSNSNIPTVYAARTLANKMLDEWAQLLFTKEIYVTGSRNATLGDVVNLDTAIYGGTGVITTVGTELSSQGLKTHIILDEKCPRIFGMWSLGNPVYVGTWGGGVKRKPIKGSTWSSYNSGLTNLFVKDLFVNNGILSCVTEDGSAYVSKEWQGYWTKIPLSGVQFPGIISSGTVMARAVTQDKATNNVKLIVDTSPELNFFDDYTRITFSGGECAVLEFTPNKVFVDCYPLDLPTYEVTIEPDSSQPGFTLPSVVTSGRDAVGIDIDNDAYNDYISIMVSGVRLETSNYGCSEGNYYTANLHDSRTVVHFDRDVEYSVDYYLTSIFAYEAGYMNLYPNVLGIYNNDLDGEALVFSYSEYDTPASGMEYRFEIRDAISKTIYRYIASEEIHHGEATWRCVKRVQEDPEDDTKDIYYVYRIDINGALWVYTWNIEESTVTEDEVQDPPMPEALLISFSGATENWEGECFINGDTYRLRSYILESKTACAVFKCDIDHYVLQRIVWAYDKETQGCYLSPTGTPWIPTTFTHHGYSILPRSDGYAVYGSFIEEYYDIYYVIQVWPGIFDTWYKRNYVTHFIVDTIDVSNTNTWEGFGTGPNAEGGIGINKSTTEHYNYVEASFSWSSEFDDERYFSNGTETWEGNSLIQNIGTIVPIKKIDTGLANISSSPVTWQWYDGRIFTLGDSFSVIEDEYEKEYQVSWPLPIADSDTGDTYWIASGIGDSMYSLVAIPEGEVTVVNNLGYMAGKNFNFLHNCGRVIACSIVNESEDFYLSISRVEGGAERPLGWRSLVLRRDDDTYAMLDPGVRPQRIDLSDGRPVVSVEDNIHTLEFIDNTISGELGYVNNVYYQPYITSVEQVGDVRCAYVASGLTTSGILSSGLAHFGNTLFVTVAGELYVTNIDDITYPLMNQDFTCITEGITFSGVAISGLGPVEVSNYQSQSQYIFTCTSGEGPQFYQKDRLPFRNQSTNLGDYPVTIIRLDDRM